MLRSNIYKWLSKYDKHGFEGLKSSKSSGPKPKLSTKQLAKLNKLLVKNPLQFKFDYALWTIGIIKELIHHKFSITYSNVQLGRLMKRLGLSRQRPLEMAIEQDPEKVKNWLAKQYPTIKKEAKKENRKIYFSDEAGFQATAQYGSIWAPKDKTPIIKTSGKREKVNVISAINNQGKLHFMLYENTFNSTVFITFLKRLMCNQKTPITLIVDGHKSHFTTQEKEYLTSTKGKLTIYQLPACSAELNPDELVWNNTKQKVAKTKHTPSKKSFKEKVETKMNDIKKTLLKPKLFSEPNVSYAM